jgi:hypothetical protein
MEEKMTTYNFYKPSEIKLARKETRSPFATFGITSDSGTIRQLIRKFELEKEWIWIEA